jgi:CheY-like chemotaxis protein
VSGNVIVSAYVTDEVSNSLPLGDEETEQITKGRFRHLETITSNMAFNNSLHLVIEVSDTGPGITAFKNQNVFSMQVSGKETGGMGNGLCIMRKRMEAIKGKCGIAPRNDGLSGSCVWFSVPYCTLECVEITPLHSMDEATVCIDDKYHFHSNTTVAISSASTVDRMYSAVEVLLVDDSTVIQRTVAKMLTAERYHVTVARNGCVALEILKQRFESFAFVIMDIQMPVMDGVEATKQFREYENLKMNEDMHRRAIIIGTSANCDEDTRLKALSSGMNDFLPKPFTINQLQEILYRMGCNI